MSLYQCAKCGAIENSALSGGGYLAHYFDEEQLASKGLDPSKQYCSECFTGQWHNRFPKEIHPLGTLETDQMGNIHKKGLELLPSCEYRTPDGRQCGRASQQYYEPQYQYLCDRHAPVL